MTSRSRTNAERLLKEQVRLHRAGVPLALAAGSLVGLMLGAVLWNTADHARLLWWMLGALCIGSFNVVVRRRHRLEHPPGEGDAVWRRRYLWSMALRGASWGLCSILVWPAHDAEGQMLITVGVSVVCALTLSLLSFDRQASWLFAVPSLAPLLWRHATAGDSRSVVLAAMLLVLGGAMALQAQQSYRRARRDHAVLAAEAERMAALRRRERQLNDAEQVANLGSFDWHLDTGELAWSPQHFRLWGLEPGRNAPDYETFIKTIHPDDLDGVVRGQREALDNGHLHECQYRVFWPDGSVRDIHARGEIFRNADGAPVRMIGTVQDVTERLRADESLRIVEFMMNAITDPIAVVDQDQVYRLVNDAWCQVNARSREQSLGCTIEQIYLDNYSDERREAVRACITEARPTVVRSTSMSLATAFRDRMIETRFLPFRDAHVAWHGVLMITRDITAAADNERALASSLDNLRLTLNATGDAIFASDASDPLQPVLFANEQLLQLWNIQPDQANLVTPALIIEHARRLFVDPDREVARIAQIIADGQRSEERITLLDGRVLVRRCIPTQAGGQNVRVWGFRDVTAEARALQALRDSEARQRVLLDAFPGYISAVDAGQTFRYANARMAQLYDLTPDQVIGRPVQAIVGSERAASVRDEVLRAMAGEPVLAERTIPARSGRPELALLLTMATGTGPAGEPWSFAFGTDITELKRTEAALLAAKEDAEQANRAKSQFLSNMSHELRTPMNAVLGFGQLLEMNTPRNLTERQLQQVQEIVRAGQHLLTLINDLLDLARIESGHMAMSLEAVALPAVIDECLQLTQALAMRHGVTMVAPSAESCSHLVMADRMRLKQVLLNLLSNAIKYNRQDGQVAIACRMDGHGLVRIEVHDTGMGLDAQAQAKLFRAFERLQADKTLTEGTGIGLALSRRLMQVMNGDIGMSSELGVGSCFWVQLPAAAATSESPRASDRPTPRALPAPAAPTFEASGTVLCIDDNPVNLALLEALMEDRPGVKMVCTVDPMQGLLLAAELRPDLILLDIQLPEIDGLEVLRRLRAAPATAGIPVIAVSADAMPDMVKHCMDSGFADYVTKPLDADHLFDAVDRELGRVRPPAA